MTPIRLSFLMVLSLALPEPVVASTPTPEELAGCREELIFQIVRPKLEEMLKILRQTRTLVTKLDVEPAGIAVAVETTVEPLQSSLDNLRQVQGVTRGILQDSLKSRSSKRKEQTDELVHDLGNVIAPISYSVQILNLQRNPEPANLQVMRRMMNTGLEKAEAIVLDRILPVITATKFVPSKALLNVNDVLTPIQALYRSGTPAVTVNINNAPLNIVANDLDVFTAVSNLCKNAQEAITMHQGGEGDIFVRAFRDRQFVVIEVRDTGPGIPAESQLRLLQRNQSDKGEGRGVGLSSVQRTIFEHDGEFYFVSETKGPDRGTTFQLRFRAAEPPPPPTR